MASPESSTSIEPIGRKSMRRTHGGGGGRGAEIKLAVIRRLPSRQAIRFYCVVAWNTTNRYEYKFIAVASGAAFAYLLHRRRACIDAPPKRITNERRETISFLGPSLDSSIKADLVRRNRVASAHRNGKIETFSAAINPEHSSHSSVH